MTHHGGLSLSIIIWRIGGGGSFLLPWGPNILLAALSTVRNFCLPHSTEEQEKSVLSAWLQRPNWLIVLGQISRDSLMII